MRKLQVILPGLLLVAHSTVFAREVDGVTIPDTVTVAGTTLQLNGAGMRKKFFLDIYAGALYLPARTSDSAAILAETTPASVTMHFVYHKVGKEKITDAWNEGLRDNLPARELQALQDVLGRFNALFTDVHKGDIIRIDFVPDKGTQVYINNELRGTVGDNTFFRALLKIWLGPDPVSGSLKQAMLGQD